MISFAGWREAVGGQFYAVEVGEVGKYHNAKRQVQLQSGLGAWDEPFTFFVLRVCFVAGQIFQLLLPEFQEESDAPLYLLLALCFIAPLWSW